MNSNLLGYLYMVGGAFYAWRLWATFEKGEMSLLFVRISRRVHPIHFWTIIVSNAFCVAVIFLVGIPAAAGWHWW